jgi:hypothetical protein
MRPIYLDKDTRALVAEALDRYALVLDQEFHDDEAELWAIKNRAQDARDLRDLFDEADEIQLYRS